jgi:hypothetical protein
MSFESFEKRSSSRIDIATIIISIPANDETFKLSSVNGEGV